MTMGCSGHSRPGSGHLDDTSVMTIIYSVMTVIYSVNCFSILYIRMTSLISTTNSLGVFRNDHVHSVMTNVHSVMTSVHS